MAAAEDSIDMIKTEHDADDLSEDNSLEIPCLKKEEPEDTIWTAETLKHLITNFITLLLLLILQTKVLCLHCISKQ